jgi:hypothetical protein
MTNSVTCDRCGEPATVKASAPMSPAAKGAQAPLHRIIIYCTTCGIRTQPGERHGRHVHAVLETPHMSLKN